MDRLELKVPPVVVFVACALITPLLAFALPGWGLFVEGSWRPALVLALSGLGLAIGVSGVLRFRAARTTVNPMRPQRVAAMVTDGIFARTRNPMYLGLALMLAGYGVFFMHISGVVSVAAFVAWITRFQIVPEERALAEKFGSGFDAYRSRVRRWI